MATPEDARRANRSHLLRTLHCNGPLAGRLGKVTGLTRASVSSVVRDLMDDGVVEELGLSTTGGVGKPATLVDIDADGRHVLCLDLSEPDHFVGPSSTSPAKCRPPHGRPQGQDRAGRRQPRRPMCGSSSPTPSGRSSASASPARNRRRLRCDRHGRPPRLDPPPLAADLSAQFDLPVRAVNDANAAALRRTDVRRATGDQPDLRTCRRGCRCRPRARRAPLRRLVVRGR